MANDELVDLVARAIVETPPEEKMIYDEGGALVRIQRDLRPTARAVVSEVYEALMRRYAELEKDPFIPRGAVDYIRNFLTASPLNGGK